MNTASSEVVSPLGFANVTRCGPTAIAGVVIICAVAHAGDVYKYVDERGNTLYTDKPIPGAVLVSTGSQKPPEAAARSYAAQQSATNNQLAASNQRASPAIAPLGFASMYARYRTPTSSSRASACA